MPKSRKQTHQQKCWLLCWLLLVATEAITQAAFFNARHYSIEEGMSARFVTNYVQDGQGFIWIATDFGINRFDGLHFKRFTTTNSKLRSNTRAYLKLGPNGKIWVNYETFAVDILDPVTEEVTPLEALVPEAVGKQVDLVWHSNDNEVWGIIDNVLTFRYNGDFHFTDKIPTSVRKPIFAHRFASPWGTLFIIVGNCLTEYNIEGQELNSFALPPMSMLSMSLNKSSIMLTGFRKGAGKHKFDVFFLEMRKNEPPVFVKLYKHGRPQKLGVDNINYACAGSKRDRQGNIWTIFQDRLVVFSPTGHWLAETPKVEDYWQLFEATDILFDNGGQAWVRGKEGIHLVGLNRSGFQKLLQKEGVQLSVRGITELPDSTLLACTYDGLYGIDTKHGRQQKLSSNIHFGILKATDGTIWLGAHSIGVHRSRDGGRTLERVRISAEVGPLNEILRPFQDTFTGQVYFGTRHLGLVLFDEASQSVVPFGKTNQFKEFKSVEIFFLLPTAHCIWVATSNGLYKLDRARGLIEHHNHFGQNYIHHLSIDEDGSLWLGTRGAGLAHWFPDSNRTERFTQEDGLSNDIIYAVYDDGRGYLWLPSNYGLVQFEKRTGMAVHYLPQDGVANEEFNNSSHWRGSDGTFYFGGLNGITAFKPEHFTVGTLKTPLVVISHEVLKGNALLDKMAAFRSENAIVVNPDELFFSVGIALLDYHSKKQIFAWKLDGLNDYWTYQSESSIRFNALPYGEYTLRVKAKGAGSNWSENELAIPVRVVRPFYKTWKFIALCVLAFSLITFFSVRWRISWLRREKQRLAKIVEERTKELSQKNQALEASNQVKARLFSIIAHDLRSPLVTLSGLARKVAFLMRQGRSQEVQELGETVEQTVASVRNLLDNLLTWSIVQDGKFPNQPELLRVADVAEEVVGLYRIIAENKGVRLSVKFLNDPMVFSDRNAISTVLRNLLDNAIKYTHQDGQVDILAKRDGTITTLEVSDTGIGIPDSELTALFKLKSGKGSTGTKGEKGNGLGLVLCKELVEANHGTITANNKPTGGAVFSVQLPAANPSQVGPAS